MRVFFDSSAFAKRYIEEEGSEDVEKTCMESTELALSVLCIPELVSALSRLKRERAITKRQYEQMKGAFLEEIEDAMIINITPSVLGDAVRIIENNPIKAMDALHVACALAWKPEIFVSSDGQQLRAARNSGLITKTIK